MADFADWDWTVHAGDQNEQEDEASKGFAHNQTNGLIFLVDCGPSMLLKHEDGESGFVKCLQCIKCVCQRKILNNEKDLFAVILYGLNKSTCDDGKAIYILQEIGQLNSKRILDLERVMGEWKSYESSDNFEMSDVFWVSSNVFSKCKKTIGDRRILLFTNNDDPHKGDSKLTRKAAAKATDLRAMGIDLELLPIKGQNGTFDVNKFYSAVLYDNPEDATSIIEPSEKFEDLLSRVYRKEHKRRAMSRISFALSDSVELSVGVYSLCRRVGLPPSVKIHRATNSEVKTLTRVFNKETGDDVMPQDIKLYQDLAGRRMCLDQEEMDLMKDFGISGLKLVGFKKISELKLHLHVKPSHFIYPDETTVKGSTKLFSALLARCNVRNVAPVCWYRPRSNSPVELVYLLPQLEELDEYNQQKTPPGFHVIFCPFKEDMRELDVMDGAQTASEEQVDCCKALIKKLAFPYEPHSFENPSLQTFYSNLEAMALNRDCPEEVTDYTIPDLSKIDKKVSQQAKEFSEIVFPPGYTFGASGTKRPTTSKPEASKKKPKLEPADIDAKELAKSDQLNKLTVNDLKDILKRECIKTPASKKADIINAIKFHYGV